jgi:predicted permease
MPAAFRSIPAAEVWTPLRTTFADNGLNYQIVARLRDAATPAQAEADFAALRPDIQRDFPRTNARRLAATTWQPLRAVVGANIRQTLLVVLGAGAFLLLIACVNVASLLLARTLTRRREFATRAALGGSRTAAARQIGVECLVLGLLGAVGGVALASVLTRALVRLVSAETAVQMLSDATPRVDWVVFAFTAVVAMVCALVFGVAPSLAASRIDLRTALGTAITPTAGRGMVWLRHTLAGVEVALAVILLVGTGLLARTLYNLVQTELGFNPDGIVVARMSLQGVAGDATGLEALYDRGLARIREVPGVSAATVSTSVPVERPLNVAVEPPAGSRVTEIRPVDWRSVTPGFFELFEIPRIAGRVFDAQDRSGREPVAIVNEAFARAYFGTPNASGARIRIAGPQEPERTIVGVVGNVKSLSGTGWVEGMTARAKATAPMIFVPAAQVPPNFARSAHAVFPVTWAVKADGPAARLDGELREAMRAIGAPVTFITVESMDAVIARDLDVPRFVATLLAAFAALAIVLAAVGLYGVIAYSASQRTREVGIRMALGATTARILATFVAEGVCVTAAGIAAGVVAAAMSTAVLTRFLFGVTPLDTSTFAMVGVLFLIVAVTASGIPAARAARINPVTALRLE